MTAALELRGIVKRFGEIAAVDSVSLSIAPGEVVALIGENGAGKSTLVAVSSGLFRADSGIVRAFGAALKPGDPRAAIEAGIGVVHQHFMLVGPLRAWENVVLGREPRRWGAIDAARARAEAAETARRFGLAIDVDAAVETLSVAMQQRVEIVKQLWRGSRVLILDEPSAVLSPAEAQELRRVLRGLAAGGRAVLFISHKLREVLDVADRIAVLRKGRLVQVTPRAEADVGQLTQAVMGVATAASVAAPISGAPRPRPTRIVSTPSDALLDVRDLSCVSSRGRLALRGLSLQIAAGEAVGIAGVDGNGQSELAKVLSGMRPYSGTARLAGAADRWTRSPAAARAAGVAHLPEDRHRSALCLRLSAEENLALGHQRCAPYARGRRIDRAGRRAKAAELIRRFDVRPPEPGIRTADLSGGNQQKLVAARELAGGRAPRLIIAAHPTRGLDPGATRLVHAALRNAQSHGAALLIISFDLDELRELSDRIAVISEGRIAGETPPDATDEALGRLMLGHGGARA